MKGAATFAAIAAIIVRLIVALSAAFTVAQTEQAIVLRFGEPDKTVAIVFDKEHQIMVDGTVALISEQLRKAVR